MEQFHSPFVNWPKGANPLDWSFEGTIEAIYRDCLQSGDATIDGGSNLGRHTFPMAERVGADGLVIAVDANQEMVEKLSARLPHETAVMPIFAALGDSEGEIEFSIAVDDPGRSSIQTPPALKNIRKLTVPQIRIDDIDFKNRRLRFIKLDLEGGEFGALLGAENSLREHNPIICFEHIKHYMHLFKLDYATFFRFFESMDYKLIDILGTEFTPMVASWDAWKPHYLVALPNRDKELSDRGLTALLAYIRTAYSSLV
jgi:FkbM family methyltransferase